MKRISLISLAAVLIMAFAATAMAAPIVCSLKPKVSSFDFLVDRSGSMMMKHRELGEKKFILAKKILLRINDRIPEFSRNGYNFTGSVHTFATDREVFPQQTFYRDVFAPAYSTMKTYEEVFNRLTPMGRGINHWSSALYSRMPQPTAVIILSDGEQNRGDDPIAAAQAALAANPGLCFHIVSLADRKEGQEVLDKIAALKPGCSVSVMAEDMLSSDLVVDKFVHDVFIDTSSLVLRSVHFALASWAINKQSAAILDEVAAILRHRHGEYGYYLYHGYVDVDGHTCSLGSEQSNQLLSERRANAVKEYLSKKCVIPCSLVTHGYGELRPKFDNSTEEGRRLNRRVEIEYNYR